MTLGEAMAATGKTLADLIIDLLLATGTAVNAVAPHNALRTEKDIESLMRVGG